MADLIVAAVGDSIMWGQGLKDEQKFVNLAAGNIAKHLGKTPSLEWFSAHSGAKIFAGETAAAAQRSRESFVDTYPTLFKDPNRRQEFLAGKNEDMVVLHGEIPAGFTTIDFQLDWIRRDSPKTAETVDLLLIDGAANDVNFEDVLNPEHFEEFITKFDPAFEKAFYVHVKKLLEKARRVFPNAVIIMTGLYTPFSDESLNDDFEDFLKEMSGKPQMMIRLNDLSGSFAFKSNIGGVLQFLDVTVDVAAMAWQVNKQANLGQSRGLYWARRAISELNQDPDIRGPGLIFAHPGFGPANALFTSEPFIHDRYKGEMIDPVRDDRERECPRLEHLRTMRLLELQLSTFLSHFELGNKIENLNGSAELHELLGRIDGPTSLVKALRSLVHEASEPLLRTALNSLNDEIGRIEVCRIASFIHPNEKGARRYAEVIAERHARHMRTSLKEALLEVAGNDSPPPDGMLSVQRSFGRYGLPLEKGVRTCMPHGVIDSIAIGIVTAKDSTFNTADFLLTSEPIELDIGGGRTWILDLLHRIPSPHFKPGSRDFFTIDTLGDLRLKDFKRLQLRRKEPHVSNLIWKPVEVSLSLNGLKVFHTNINTPVKIDDTLTLSYPA